MFYLNEVNRIYGCCVVIYLLNIQKLNLQEIWDEKNKINFEQSIYHILAKNCTFQYFSKGYIEIGLK